jgi:hypothetical protein
MSRIEELEMRLEECRDEWQISAKNAAKRLSEFKSPSEVDVQWLASVAGSLVWGLTRYTELKTRLSEAIRNEEKSHGAQ